MRELVYTLIAGNAYIKKEDKPTKDQIIKLSIDRTKEEKVVKKKPLSPAEIEKIRQQLMKKMNAK